MYQNWVLTSYVELMSTLLFLVLLITRFSAWRKPICGSFSAMGIRFCMLIILVRVVQGLWPQPRWIGCRHVDYHILKKLMFHRSRDSVSRLCFGCWVLISPFISLPFIDVHRYIITYLIHTLRSYECLGDRKEFRRLVIYTFSILNRDFSRHILTTGSWRIRASA